MPSVAQAAHTDIKNHEATHTDVKESDERNNKKADKGLKNKIKNLSTTKKVGLGVGALSAVLAIGAGVFKGIPAIFGDRGGSQNLIGNNSQQTKSSNKTVLLGDTNSGKTALIDRIAKNNFAENYYPTFGVDFRTKMYSEGEQQIKQTIWDTAGQERFRSMSRPYCRGTDLFVFTISLENGKFEKQVENIKQFFEMAKDEMSRNARGIVVMTKADLSESERVGTEQAKTKVNSLIENFNKKNNIQGRITLFETSVSAKSGDGIKDLENKINEKFTF